MHDSERRESYATDDIMHNTNEITDGQGNTISVV